MERARIAGRVLEVTEQNAGATITEDVSASDTTLPLDDATYFLAEGGEALIFDDANSETVTYVSVDLDADTIELDSGLANAYEAEATVELVPALPLRYAEFAPTGAADDTLRVTVDTVRGLFLPVGTREDSEREQIVVGYDPETDVYVVEEVFSNAEAETFINEDITEELAFALPELTDVADTVDSADDGDVLTWDAYTGEWIALPGGVGGSSLVISEAGTNRTTAAAELNFTHGIDVTDASDVETIAVDESELNVGGDLTGTVANAQVTDDSHNHTGATLGSGINYAYLSKYLVDP